MKIARILNRPEKRADLGIEIEVESDQLLPTMVVGWDAKRDGSLRGNSMEYVTAPIKEEVVDVVMASLRESFNAHGAKVNYSFRAGVHVHINCLGLTVEELVQFVMCYLILEIPLVNYCGTDRVGNAFCLRTIDAEGGLTKFIHCLRNNEFDYLDDDSIRYGSINYKAIPTYGTVEFRCMATHEDFDKTDDWAKTLLHIRNFAKEFGGPNEIMNSFSEGVEDFCRKALGPYYNNIFPEGINSAEIFEGLDYAQDLAYYKY